MQDNNIYHCTANGSDATARFDDKGFFIVEKGSKHGSMSPTLDSLARISRQLSAPNDCDFKGVFVLTSIFPYDDVDVAARAVSGCPCDHTAWTSPDGFHPIVRKPSE